MTVHLVGAGPGDPGLLTVRAAALLAEADVIVCDALVSPEILELARPDAEVIDVGKRRGTGTPQEEINELLIRLGRTGRSIVRLKGGDPFVFGRGGEEAIALRTAGLEVTVVPAVTSAIAGPASAGIPLTHRGVSSSFTVVTGHRENGGLEGVDWDAIGRLNGTVVILMGVVERGDIARRLMDAGRSTLTPVAVVVNATRADQRVVRSTLGSLIDVDVEAPAVIVIGDVAGMNVFGRAENVIGGCE
ncbi:MAG: uroporphyrinogen-III C-methyltransferase [Actinomycetota bacterium]